MHVGTSSGGSEFKPGTVQGHGWVECGSSQVIQSSNAEFRSYYELFNTGLLSVQVSTIKGASNIQVWGSRLPIPFSRLKCWLDYAMVYIRCSNLGCFIFPSQNFFKGLHSKL